jgi:hypothetical protein
MAAGIGWIRGRKGQVGGSGFDSGSKGNDSPAGLEWRTWDGDALEYSRQKIMTSGALKAKNGDKKADNWEGALAAAADALVESSHILLRHHKHHQHLNSHSQMNHQPTSQGSISVLNSEESYQSTKFVQREVGQMLESAITEYMRIFQAGVGGLPRREIALRRQWIADAVTVQNNASSASVELPV